MLIYQVKIEVDPGIEDEWQQYMKRIHVPDVLATGLIVTHQIWKISDSEIPTYCYNYFFKDKSSYEQYNRDFASALRADPIKKFKNKFKASRQFFDLV